MTTSKQQVCPICYSTEFRDFNRREQACCSGCGSMERGRLAWVILSRLGQLKRGTRMLNFAPEKFMLTIGKRIIGSKYEAADFSPELFGIASSEIRKVDMCHDLASLDQGSYDVIMHNHVLEHVPCHVPIVLKQLNNLVRPGGYHIFSIPIFPSRLTEEDLSPDLSAAEKSRRFGQNDHVRIFGADYILMFDEAGITSGFVDVHDIASDEEMSLWGIPPDALRTASPHRVFVWKNS